MLLAEYRGRLIPKYYPLEVAADAEQEDKVMYLNQVAEGSFILENSVKAASILEDLRDNYTEISSKPLEANVKIDQDLIN